ncbi:MAG: hypothetical protein Kow002_17910 [Anaerolineales bacterium]
MSEHNSEINDIQVQRTFWAAVFVVLAIGVLLGFSLFQRMTGPAQNLIPVISFSAGMLVAIAGAVLARTRYWNIAPFVSFYAAVLAILAPSVFIAGRGLLPPVLVTVISAFLIFFVFPTHTRKHPIAALILAVGIYLVLEWVNPAYRVAPPSSTRIGPWVGVMFAFAFILLLISQRWEYLRIRAKVTLLASSLLIVVISSLTYYAVTNIRHVAEQNEEEQFALLYEGYNNYVRTLEQEAATLAVSLADRQDIVDLYLAQDRQGLLNLLTPLFNTLSRRYNIAHLYIENPDGTVFVRVHNPEEYGDDITYRLTAAEALISLGTVTGVEIGPSRLGVRSVTPLTDGARYVGLLEVGIDYDTKFIQSLRADTGADYTMWITKEAAAPAGLGEPQNAPVAPHPELLFYASTSPGAARIPQNVYQQVLRNSRPAIHYISNGEEDLAVLVAPLLGYRNRTIGVIEIIKDRSETLAHLQTDTRNILLAAGLIALISIVILRVFAQYIFLRPLAQLSEAATKQSEGDLSIRVNISGQDEIHDLAVALNTLTEKVQESLSELEVRVAERTMDLEMSNRESQHRAAQFQAVAKVAQASANIKELDILLPRITELISQQFGYYHAGIFMLDSAREYAVLAAANSEGGKKMLARKHRLRVGAEGIVGFVTRTGNPRIALNVGEDSVHFNNPDLPNTQSEMALPLKIGTQIIGALDVQSTAANAFSENDVEVLSTLADQVALAIENARLFEETQRLLRETQIAFGERIQTSWLKTAETLSALGYTLSGSRVQPLEKPLDDENISQAIKTGSIVISQADKDKQLEAVAVPIKIREQVIGTLNIQLPPNHNWGADEIDIAEAIASRIGLAIETATLIKETAQRAAFERTTSEISDKLSASTRFDAILRTAAEELSKALGGSEVLVQIQPGVFEDDKDNRYYSENS